MNTDDLIKKNEFSNRKYCFFLAVANAMIIGYKKGMYKQRQFAPGDCVGCQDPT
jgi:hypothetical protein